MLKKKLIINDPFEEFAYAPQLQKQKKTIQYGTVEDIIKVIQNGPERYTPDWFWIRVTRFLYLTGIRRRQLISIIWEHIDFNHQILTICAHGSKNKKERKLPLPEILISDLQFLLQKHEDTGKVARSGQVFNITRFNSKYHGSVCSADQISGFYKRFSKSTGISVSPHRFRHTMATELGNMPDTNIFVLANILGHSDLRVTRQYVEKKLKPQIELLKKLEQHLTKENNRSK